MVRIICYMVFFIMLFACKRTPTEASTRSANDSILRSEIKLYDTIINEHHLLVNLDTSQGKINIVYDIDSSTISLPRGFDISPSYSPFIVEHKNGISNKFYHKVLTDDNRILVPISCLAGTSVFILIVKNEEIKDIFYIPFVKGEISYDYVMYYRDDDMILAERRDATSPSVPGSRIYSIKISEDSLYIYKQCDFNWQKIYNEMYHSEHDMSRYVQLDKIYNSQLR